MKVKAILDAKGREVATIRPEATVATAIRRLTLENIGALVVSLDGASVLGVSSERDIIRAFAREGDAALVVRLPVERVMAQAFKAVTPDDDLRDVMGEMTRRRMRHLPVLEGGRLAGIVSIGDAVKSRLEQLELETSVLRDAYIAGR